MINPPRLDCAAIDNPGNEQCDVDDDDKDDHNDYDILIMQPNEENCKFSSYDTIKTSGMILWIHSLQLKECKWMNFLCVPVIQVLNQVQVQVHHKWIPGWVFSRKSSIYTDIPRI